MVHLIQLLKRLKPPLSGFRALKSTSFGLFYGATSFSSRSLIKSAARLAHIPVQPNVSETCDWTELGLAPNLCENLKRLNIFTPNPIQRKCIPICLGESSVVLTAETGSGKTLVYATAMVQKISALQRSQTPEHCHPLGMILIPSKELAWQVALEIKRLAAGTNIDVLFRKVDMVANNSEKKRYILIATPSTLFRSKPSEMREMLDLLIRARMVVVDEMDLLLSGTFTSSTQQLLERLKAAPQRQFVFCGATLPPPTSIHASRTYLLKKFPKLVYVDTETVHCTVPTLKETFVDVPATLNEDQIKHWKVSHMGDLLRGYAESHTLKAAPELPRIALVFFNEVKSAIEFCGLAKEFFSAFPSHEILCLEFHKEVPKQTREERLKSLRLGWVDSPTPPKLVILFTTDLLSRGIDLPNLDLVIQAHFPTNVTSYLHRAGRTARAGRPGQTVSYVSPKDRLLADRVCAVAAEKSKLQDTQVSSIKFENLFSHRRSLSRKIKGGDNALSGPSEDQPLI